MAEKKIDNVIIWIVLILGISALLTKEVITMVKTGDAKVDFKTNFLKFAQSVLGSFGIDPTVPMAQAALESNYGQSQLTTDANNLFGLTPGSDWVSAMNKQIPFSQVAPWSSQGTPVVYFNTKEYSKTAPNQLLYWDFPGDIVSKKDDGNGGTIAVVKRPFRSYTDWGESIKDWANHISTMSRYAPALAAAQNGDLDTFASAIQQGGWATDPAYATGIVNAGNALDDVQVATA